MRLAYYSADTQSIEMRCSTCGDWWPAELEFFRVARSGRVGSQCRACHNDAAMARYYQQRAQRATNTEEARA